jgi:hypothetical protein
MDNAARRALWDEYRESFRAETTDRLDEEALEGFELWLALLPGSDLSKLRKLSKLSNFEHFFIDRLSERSVVSLIEARALKLGFAASTAPDGQHVQISLK